MARAAGPPVAGLRFASFMRLLAGSLGVLSQFFDKSRVQRWWKTNQALGREDLVLAIAPVRIAPYLACLHLESADNVLRWYVARRPLDRPEINDVRPSRSPGLQPPAEGRDPLDHALESRCA